MGNTLDIDIRHVPPRERSQASIRELLSQYHQSLPDYAKPYAIGVDDYQSEHILFWLAHFENQIAGCIAAQMTGSRAELKSLYVRPAFLGHSLGSKLIETVVSHAQGEASINTLWLTTGNCSYFEAAKRLYTLNGFIETQIDENVTTMQLVLDTPNRTGH